MKIVDKVVATIVCMLLLVSGYVYLLNYDMYRLVDNYNPIGGYSALADRLSDDGWVTSTCEDWKSSSSPVMRRLFLGLTVDYEELPIAVIQNNRLVQATAMLVSLSVWPVSVIVSAVRAKPKEATKHG